MADAYLDDDGGPEVAAVEAVPEGVDVKPGAILARVGYVFYGGAQPSEHIHDDDGTVEGCPGCFDDPAEEPGVWVGYQPAYRHSRPEGPVLLTPALWRELNEAVEQRLADWHDMQLTRKYTEGGGCER